MPDDNTHSPQLEHSVPNSPTASGSPERLLAGHLHELAEAQYAGSYLPEETNWVGVAQGDEFTYVSERLAAGEWTIQDVRDEYAAYQPLDGEESDRLPTSYVEGAIGQERAWQDIGYALNHPDSYQPTGADRTMDVAEVSVAGEPYEVVETRTPEQRLAAAQHHDGPGPAGPTVGGGPRR